MRKSEIQRKTSETEIVLKLVLDSPEKSIIDSGVPFFDHMLDAMSRHGHFFIDLHCRGDNELDDHHSIEDIGICLGKAFKKALGEKGGIRRFGHAVIPMDDALSSRRPIFQGARFSSTAASRFRDTSTVITKSLPSSSCGRLRCMPK